MSSYSPHQVFPSLIDHLMPQRPNFLGGDNFYCSYYFWEHNRSERYGVLWNRNKSMNFAHYQCGSNCLFHRKERYCKVNMMINLLMMLSCRSCFEYNRRILWKSGSGFHRKSFLLFRCQKRFLALCSGYDHLNWINFNKTVFSVKICFVEIIVIINLARLNDFMF